MSPELAVSPVSRFGHAIPQSWRAALVRLGAAWLALGLCFAGDWAAIAGQWWNSSTYNHALLIPVIIGWLVWQRAPQLLELDPRPWWPGLVGLGGALLVWLLGAMAGFDLLRQAGVVALLPMTAVLLLGVQVSAGLAFPLAYCAFLVPFGDELVPALQTITAKLTVALVHLSGIRASIDGVFIDTPAGLFQVAEACSGVKFLIAMIALGVLVANLCFRSWRRRVSFLTLCVVAPILANGVRAWGTIFAAQYVGVKRAGGIDHLIYGWIFFALVIAGVLALSWRYFDRKVEDPFIDPGAIRADAVLKRLADCAFSPRAALGGVAALAAVTLGWAYAADRLRAPMPQQIFLPAVPGWQRVGYSPTAPWEPRAAGAEHRLFGSYRDGAGRRVEVFYALYAAQDEGAEAGGYGQGALPAGTDWNWIGPGADIAGTATQRLRWQTSAERTALTYYRTGDLLTASNARLKLANIADRLMLRPEPTMLLILSAEDRPGVAGEGALADFARAIGDPGPWMDRIGKVR